MSQAVKGQEPQPGLHETMPFHAMQCRRKQTRYQCMTRPRPPSLLTNRMEQSPSRSGTQREALPNAAFQALTFPPNTSLPPLRCGGGDGLCPRQKEKKKKKKAEDQIFQSTAILKTKENVETSVCRLSSSVPTRKKGRHVLSGICCRSGMECALGPRERYKLAVTRNCQ